MSANLNDWTVFMAEFNRAAVHWKWAPSQVPGRNLMTPEVLGTYITRDGDRVELSTGTGMDGERIWGLTWPDRDGIKDDRSRCVFDWADVLAVFPEGPR